MRCDCVKNQNQIIILSENYLRLVKSKFLIETFGENQLERSFT